MRKIKYITAVNKWMNIGLCLVPGEKVQPQTVKYALRWFLVNYQMQHFSRIAFLLDWLTGNKFYITY